MYEISTHNKWPTLPFIFVITVVLTIAWTPFLQTLFPHVSYGDEGLIVQSAYRVYLGEVPYRDFFSAATPGSYYWTALFFKLLGPSFLAVRIGTLVAATLILLCTCLVLYRFNIRNKTPYLMVAAFLAYFVGPYWFVASHHWVSLLFCLLSFIFLLPDDSGKQKKTDLVLAGFFAALVVFTMQHLGAAWVISACLAFLAITKGERLQPFLYFIAGGLLFAIPVAGLFFAAAGIDTIIYDLITFPLTRYHEIADHKGIDLAYFSQIWQKVIAAWPQTMSVLDISRFTTVGLLFFSIVTVYLLPFIGIAALVYLWRKPFFSRTHLGFLTAFFCAQYLTALNRIMDASMVYAAPAALFAIILAITQWSRQKHKKYVVKTALQTVWISLFSGLFLSAVIFQITSPKQITETPSGPVASLTSWDHADLQGLNNFFKFRKQPSDSIYFHPYSPMLYFLFQAKNTTPYDTLVYPMNTQKQFKEVISILDKKKVKWIVLTTQDKGDPILNYLAVNYRMVGKNPYAIVFARR